MLARLQQFIAATLAAVALGALIWGSAAGRPWLVVAFLLLVLVGYGGVLAVEFASLHASYARDDPMRPALRQLVRAWATEVCAGPRVFLWRQPFRSRSEPDHLGATSLGRRGVVFIHGFFCNRGLWNRWMRRLRPADTPFAAVNLEPIFGSIDDYGPTIGAAVARVREATGMAPVIVAHSMGGLATRAWLASAPGADVHHIVTIASPHAGTRLGARGEAANIAQMRFGSPWLAALDGRESATQRARFTCFWGHCDNIVFPTRSATLAGADNRHLEVTPHVHMVDHPAVFAEVERLLAEAR